MHVVHGTKHQDNAAHQMCRKSAIISITESIMLTLFIIPAKWAFGPSYILVSLLLRASAELFH